MSKRQQLAAPLTLPGRSPLAAGRFAALGRGRDAQLLLSRNRASPKAFQLPGPRQPRMGPQPWLVQSSKA